jgi:hypothetical protein
MDNDISAADIEAEFADWRAWMSDTGSWWAARKTNLTATEQNAGCVPYLQAPTPDNLKTQIKEQEHLRLLAAQAGQVQ